MKRYKKFWFAICLVSLAALCVAFSLTASAKFGYELFDLYGVSMESDQTVSSESGIKDSRTGALLQSTKDGSHVEFREMFVGSFETEFRVFTDEPGNAADPGVTAQNATLKKLVFTFTDAENTENSFDIVLDASSEDVVTPQVSVRKDGQSAGVWYRNGTALGNTSGANEQGYYTTAYGTSFVNLAKSADGYDAANVSSIQIGYNNGEVWTVSNGTKVTVWDWKQGNNDGKLFEPMSHTMKSFHVSISFEDILDGKTAKVLLYTVNGLSVGDSVLRDKEVPGLAVEAETVAVVGKPYSIPLAICGDLVDGVISDISVSVKTIKGAVIPVRYTDGEEATELLQKEGISFTPNEAGEYIITYKAKDLSGNQVKKQLLIEAKAAEPESIFSVKTGEEIVGVGAIYNVYGATATNQYYLDGRQLPVTITLLKDSQTVQVWENLNSGEVDSIALEEEGEYVIRYQVADSVIKDVYEFTVTVTSEIPVFKIAGTISENIFCGEVLQIPSAMVSFQGSESVAEAKLILPDGSAYTCESWNVEQPGMYTIVYSVKINDVMYHKQFSVLAEPKSADLFENLSNATIEGPVRSHLNAGLVGVQVKTSGIGSIQYNRVIDFSDKTKDDVFLELIITPETAGAVDFRELKLYLTDTENPENKVEIDLTLSLDDAALYSWAKIGANGERPAGIYNGSLLDDRFLGALFLHSFSGIGASSPLQEQTCRLSFDYEEKALYVNGNFVRDLDNADQVNTLWEGFETGKATLTISTSYILTTSASFMILEVDGNRYDKVNLADSEAPVIHIQSGKESVDAMPFGVVGKKYPFFAASAYDKTSGNTEVKMRVYREYGTPQQAEFDINNGSFVPTLPGRYTVVYSASDWFGNVSAIPCSFDVIKAESYQTPTLTSEPLEDCLAGIALALPKYSLSGGSGVLSVKHELQLPDESIVLVEDSYIPEVSGSYSWKITVTDYLGEEKIFELPFNVLLNPDPVTTEVNIPQTALAGKNFVIPEFSAWDYSDGSKKDAEVYVEVDYGGSIQKLQPGDVFVPAAISGEDRSSMTVRFIAKNSNGVKKEIPFDVTVANGGTDFDLKIMNYFVGTNVTSSVGSENELIYSVTGENAGLEFVNPLPSGEFMFRFSANGTTDGIRLIWTDEKDSSIQLDVYVKNIGSDSVEIFLNGESVGHAAGSFDGSSGFLITIGLNEATNKLVARNASTDTDIELCTVQKDKAGKAFTGFPSGRLRMKVEFVNASVGAQLIPRFLNTQILDASVTMDEIRPSIQIYGTVKYIAQLGDVVEVPYAVATDILDPDCTMTVSVRGPSGILLEEQAVTSGLSFKCEEYGRYQVVYTAMDTAGNMMTSRLSVYVRDEIAPELTVNGTIPQKAKVGAKITLPSATGTDNIYSADELELSIFVVEDNFAMRAVKEGTVTFDRAGTYEIRYYLRDPDYNITMQSFIVKVS